MRTWAKGTSRAVLTAGFVALGVSAIPVNAFADVTTGHGGVLSGNQVNAPISAPVDVSGNGVALVGGSKAKSRGGAKVDQGGSGGGQRTSGKRGVGSGNQVNAPISLPVNACGNAVAIVGGAKAGCEGGAKVKGSGQGGQTTDGTGGVLAGNQVKAPISVPVNACGNAVAVVGGALAGCDGGSKVKSGGNTGSRQKTSGVRGVGSGNQADVPISVPVDVCGNAVGNAVAACEGGASVRNGGHRTGRQTTSGARGILSGNQGNAPISIPVTACGNAAALVGEAGALCEGGAHVRSGSGGDQQTSGVRGILSGNQGNAPISVPAEVCGNAAAVVGGAAAACNGQTLVKGPHGSGAKTSGDQGTGSGNQANAPVQVPAEVCGNAAAVVGRASAVCEEPGNGGYEPYSRTAGTAPRPGSKIDPPAVGGLDGVPVLSGGAGLVDGLPAQGKSAGRNQRTALGGDDAPAAVSLLDTQALPGGTGLPKVNGRGAAAGLPGVNGASPVLPGTKALPQAQGLIGQGAPVRAGAQRVRPAAGAPGTIALPATAVVPVDVHGAATARIADVPDEIGRISPVASTQTITPGTRVGATLLVAVSGLLAAAIGTLALTRRVRVGRR
ncbi:chaplin family protein [Actinomadura mexicana]|uniref:Small secreted domain n=1 Tax=Actinomadura mexicana TaxID=134959 RepID=A0A238VM82_9ACTN|nr:chaplin family protein [Actinomadura mexicana]SNR35291.1 Small secreted domain [Actinomadura mexicana]